jgi:hypothetical protein
MPFAALVQLASLQRLVNGTQSRRAGSKRCTQMWRNVSLSERSEDTVDHGLSDIDQNISTFRACFTVFSCTVIIVEHLVICCKCHPVIIELIPPSITAWFEQCQVLTTPQVTIVNNNAMKPVCPRFRFVSRAVQEFCQVYLGRVLVTSIKLAQRNLNTT